MMKGKYIYMFSILSVMLAACNVQEPVGLGTADVEEKVQQIVPGVVQGELFVRFDASVSEVLEKAGLTKSGPAMPMTRSGVLTVDEILDLVDGYRIERVFPVDSRSEEKARNEGLHLWYVVRFGAEHPVEEVAANLSMLGEVSRVEFNRTLKRADNGTAKPLSVEAVRRLASGAASENIFNDGLLEKQWHLVNNGNLGPRKFIAGCDVQVAEAWKLCKGDPSIIVAVLDEGVDYSHPDLKGSMWENEGEVWRSHEDNDGNGYAGDLHGYNFVKDSGVISADNVYDSGHGTHVAGVIAAVNNNKGADGNADGGICSIAGGDYGAGKAGVKIMSCQIFSGNTSGTLLDEVRAIKYAADNGAVILQCSWGYTSGAANPFDWTPEFSDDDQWKESNVLESIALDYFIHNAGSPDGVIEGGIAVFASGNEYAPAAGYPGAYPDFVSVAATAADFTPAVYTNYGGGTTICAPGGDQDYYYDYVSDSGELGLLGCILSTLPYNVSESGYGYMEGTSMACPHVSGVVALGLSYAAQLRKHFKADEIKELLYSSSTPIDNAGHWNLDAPKSYYKYVADLGLNHPQTLDLNGYVGKMGAGMVNAYGFLKAIEGAGTDMTFPNVYLAVGKESVMLASMYFKDGESLNYEVSVADEMVASCDVQGKKLIFKGLKAGQTAASVKSSDGRSFSFVITVRNVADGDGWL